MRLQLALNVADIDQAVDYYSRILGVEVHKREPGYANFVVEDPGLKLVLFEAPGATDRLNHVGFEVFTDTDVLLPRWSSALGWGRVRGLA